MHRHPQAARRLRSKDGDVNETGLPAQFDLLATERQLTLDGHEEPLVAASNSVPVGSEGGEDTRTLPLPLAGVARQLELAVPRWMQACERKAWHFDLEEQKTGQKLKVPFRCHSWRHQGDCARHVARRDFARIAEALDGAPFEDIVYVVLTLPQTKDEARGLSIENAYGSIQRRWQSFIQWLRREFGPAGYVATVEQHRTGWPHLNVVVACAGFAQAIRDEGREDGVAPGWMKGAAVRCGFGYRAWAEAPKDVRKLAGYLVKLAHRETLVGEVTKLSQLPLASPAGTRRLRSSRGFLPTRVNESSWTGELKRYSIEEAARLEREALEFERRAEEEALEEARAYWERELGDAPQRDPKGAGGAAKPASEAGGASGVRGRSPWLVTTGTSHSAVSWSEAVSDGRLPPEAQPGADPPF